MSLSSGLTLADLSDYLAPSQICIKPVTMLEDTSPDPIGGPDARSADKDAAVATTEIVIDAETRSYYEAGTDGRQGKKLKKAEITLNDCLACSGCITSAESVLVSMQSHEEVYRVLEERPDLLPILSVSPQSVASLAALHDLSLAEACRGLRLFFKRELNFKLVFDTTFAREISLEENRREYLERRKYAAVHPKAPLPTSSVADKSDINSPATSSIGPLPILSSACPGWICYAEKTHGELLPFVSNVKSPQAVMGTLVKGGEVAASLGLKPDQIYHVTVMPCYDKKLEASRPDFATPYASASTAEPIRDVDCVLTTGEVERMMTDKGLSLRALALESADAPIGAPDLDISGAAEAEFMPSSLLSTPPRGTSSGGYVHNALQAVLASLSADELARASLTEQRVRNDDYVEYTVRIDGVPRVKLAKCYGFRNLQNVVRKLGRDKGVAVIKGAAAAGRMPVRRGYQAASSSSSKGKGKDKETDVEVEFVEVMACPSGCVNGGGQIAPPKESRAARRRKLNGYTGQVDDEGMPQVGDDPSIAMMDVDHEEHGHGHGVGHGDDDDERVFTPKEWVAEVERKYWSGHRVESCTPVNANGAHTLDESIRPYAGAASTLADAVERAVAALLRDVEEVDRDDKRKALLRTSYRAVESEEINGLAVKW